WRHYEAEHEAEGLRVWHGNGAVRLHECADYDDTIAMLLERCVPGTSLAAVPAAEQDAIVAGLLRQLWIEPPARHVFRPLQKMCDDWAREFEAKQAAGRVRVDAGLARDGIALFRTLP